MSRQGGMRKAFVEKFEEELRFFRGWIDKPKAVGALLPTSGVTARRMASIIDVSSGLPVLELGAGTGVITQAILERGVEPQALYAIEYSPDFVAHLRGRFAGVNIIEGDAFDLDRTLAAYPGLRFDSIVSGVPLLNFPVEKRIAYLESLLDRIPTGRPVVQITYGPRSPIPPHRGSYTVEHHDFVMRNLPPAQLWVYRRALHA